MARVSTLLIGALLIGALLLGALLLGATGAGAETWPAHPVRIVVPYAPGGATDVLARLIAPGLTERLGKPVVVENRTGANGVIGVQLVAKAAPDGYTLLMGTIATHGIQPTLLKDLPYDPLKDFVPLVQVASQAYVVLVHPSFPAHTLADLVAEVKRRPDGLHYASAGSGTGGHLFAAYWAGLAGLTLTPVHYRGAAPSTADVVSGQLPMTFDLLLTTLQHITAGTLRALAVTSAARAPQLPALPTVAEQGYPDFEAVGWNGLFLPVETPRDIVERLGRAVNAVLADAQVRERVTAQGAVVVGGSPDAFASLIHAEVAKWAAVIRDQHVTPE